jgi:6-phosphogluconolactonase
MAAGSMSTDLPMSKPHVEIASDAQDLALRALRLFASTAGEAVAARGIFCTALSGGRTPELFFHTLATEPQAKAIPWNETHVFWVDERCVPPDSQASNYRLAAEAFLNRVEIPQANVHRIGAELGNSGEAVRAYERTIREVFGLREGEMPQFDLIVLGMGSDGHTASLFPNSPMAYDADDLACVVYAPVGAKPQVNRITLTPRVLLAARRLVVLVSGPDKAQTLKEVLAGEAEGARYPIRMLWPALERVIWLVDREAAGEIAEA